MTKLYEYQSKDLLKKMGINTCRGKIATSPEEVSKITQEIGKEVVIKAQALITSRAKHGGIKFAKNAEEAEKAAREILGMKISGHEVEKVLVEEKINLIKECFASIIVNDAHKSPVLVFSNMGGSGIEELAENNPEQIISYPINVIKGLPEYRVRNSLIKVGVPSDLLLKISDLLVNMYHTAKKYEARSVEINPIGITEDNKVLAIDARITVDDNAVFRHPELGIEVAREFDHPPTKLERIAYLVEANDYRGTFYFMQLDTEMKDSGYIAFHGAGGGGSMMAMDGLQRAGFKLPNFCDTSGNPPASKIYRAAKIILSQENLEGYFYSGSGVASQEQYHTARGLVKAFRELNLSIPAVIRVGGNAEEEAIDILKKYTADLPAPIEAYGRDISVDYCAQRLKHLIEEQKKAQR